MNLKIIAFTAAIALAAPALAQATPDGSSYPRCSKSIQDECVNPSQATGRVIPGSVSSHRRNHPHHPHQVAREGNPA